MRTRLMTVSISAMTIAGALTLSAQQAPQAPQSTPMPQAQPPIERAAPAADAQSTPATAGQTLVIVGCLKSEEAVPGLKASVTERAGLNEDYVLTDVKMSPSSAVSGIGLAAKYEVEGIAGSDLKKHINHQVELTGTIASTDGKDKDAPDFKATNLKMVAATCTPQ